MDWSRVDSDITTLLAQRVYVDLSDLSADLEVITSLRPCWPGRGSVITLMQGGLPIGT